MKERPPGRRSRRLLADHEHALWRIVTQDVAPLRRHPPRRAEQAEPAPSTPADAGSGPAMRPIKVVAPAPVAPPSDPQPATLDRRLRQRLSRGAEPIEARLDLHGLTQREAHAALVAFLRRVQSEGARNVLVITGKGRFESGPDDPYVERGVLRRQVPLWLRLPELKQIVLGFEAAHAGHGGEGALYVRLRRPRLKA